MKENLQIPKGTWEALKKLADKRGHSLGETLRHAVNTEVYMDDRMSEGRPILCRDFDGTLFKVVFTHMQSKLHQDEESLDDPSSAT